MVKLNNLHGLVIRNTIQILSLAYTVHLLHNMRHDQIRRIDQLVLLQGNFFFLQIQIECNPEVVAADMAKTFK